MVKRIKTKIVCTIGPSSWNRTVLKSMVSSGMTAARVNASFADEQEIKRVYKTIREISPNIALILDTKGHKIRLCDFPSPIYLKKGDILVIDSQPNEKYLWVNYKTLYKEVPAGTVLLLDEGKIEVKVEGKDETRLVCKVMVGGVLTRGKTVTPVGVHLDFPPLTDKDKKDILTAVECGYDFIAASFIRNVDDVRAIKSLLKGTNTKVISKIENSEGIENLDSILDESDGIMVARGDLGVELPIEKVGMLQKEIVKKCNENGRPVIVATHMLESMIENPRPTRAEVSDITNAILDGADALMLSAETSVGKYPVKCVDVMSKIASYVENFILPQKFNNCKIAKSTTNAIANGIYEICQTSDIKAVIIGTISGITARVVSRYRLRQNVIAFTEDEYVKRSLQITKGVFPEVIKKFSQDKKRIIDQLVKSAYEKGYINKGDNVIVSVGESILGREQKLLEVVKV